MSKPVLIETSARHIHVSREDLATLFGAGHELTHKKDLSQPGQYACEERVRVAGPKGEFPSVSILGPVRPASQVELSAGDARSIGIKAPVRESGNTAGAPGCTLVGPNGSVNLKEGVIVAKRHIHMTPADAEKYTLADKQIVQVAVQTGDRSLTFGDVVVRVHPNFALAMHVDTDESNAAGLAPDSIGEILG
ncbi:MAG: phosphate propanoyltransferase [Oscillospiraceae bacterium]|jgi:putative phosphotransacetylase|nr:phosphate propanoyltransferase [Oscillospiraceae bacterium]